jgi:hypothetical protein
VRIRAKAFPEEGLRWDPKGGWLVFNLFFDKELQMDDLRAQKKPAACEGTFGNDSGSSPWAYCS